MNNTTPFISFFYRYFLLLLCSASTFQVLADELSPAYSLGYGDVVSITVYGQDDLAVESQLNDLGVISFPFLGEIQVLGLTVAEVQDKITKGLQDGYLVNPKVSVSVTEYRRFYVNGEVKQPGGFAFLPGLTIRKAISLAGGFTPRAAQNKIYIVSDSQENGDENSDPIRVELNTQVKPGDVVTVRKRFF